MRHDEFVRRVAGGLVGGIFINYRGADSDTAAALIDRELTERFGRRSVFLDCLSVPAGSDFVDELLGRLRTSSVLLVVIGSRWLTLTNADGRRRIDDSSDWIRREIVEAFAHGLRVIPVLTDNAKLPAEAELPSDIAALCRRQYVLLRRRYPTVDLDHLVARIIEAEPDLAGRREVTRGAGFTPRQLPLAVRDFVGRVDRLGEMDALLSPGCEGMPDAVVIAVLDGTAGVGKTTLAVWWAHQVEHHFPDGTLFADLRGYGPGAPLDPTAVLLSFLHALGVPENSVPDGLDAQVGMYRSLLMGRSVLILLDNAASADQVRPLLPGCAGCLVLITSRSTLTGLVVTEAAHRIVIERFTPTEAEELVCGVVGADRAAAEPHAIDELVRLCARLPLALRIATSRLARRHTSIAELVEELIGDQARLDTLSRTGDERTAVRTVFDWSYNRLSAEQARMFRRLGLHPGLEVGVHAAAALTGTDTTTAHRHLDALIDVHLVESAGRQRYRLHDLLRAYATYRLHTDDTPGERHKALTAALTWYAQSATAADQMVFPVQPSLDVELGPAGPAPFIDRAQAWTWLTTECTTLLTALRHTVDRGSHGLTIALSGTMRFFAFRPRAWWHQRLEAESHGLVAARASGNTTAEAVLLRRRADTYQMLERWAESDADLERCIDMALKGDDLVLYGRALCGLGRNCKLQQRYTDALAYYQQALPLIRGTPTGHVEAVVEANLSQINARLDRYHDARQHAERELALRQGIGDLVGEGYALHNLAIAWQGLGDHDTAIVFGERAIAIFRPEAAAERYLADALETVAISIEHTGKRAKTIAYLAEALTILTASDDPHVTVLHRRLQDLGYRPLNKRKGDCPTPAQV